MPRKSGSKSGSSGTGGESPPKELPPGTALKDSHIEEALVSGEHRDLLEKYFGEESYEELRVLASRARTARTRGGPKVLILPGIMGSKLGTEGRFFDDTLWIDVIEIAAGHLTQLSLRDGREDIEAIGVLLFTYLKLKLRLMVAGFDAQFYPFDWRRSIPELGRELAAYIRRKTKAERKRKHLYLVAHSMGGLVSRAAIKQLGNDGSKVKRLIMLGTPNHGSFSPVQALSGNHSLVKKVAALASNSHEELVNDVFNTFPGLYQMLPSPQKYTAYNLYNRENWPGDDFQVREDLLAAAPRVHDRLATGQTNFTLIAGVNQETVVGVRRQGDEFRFSVSPAGDGTVPLDFALLDDTQTYFVEESHGSLPNNADVGSAVIDLLRTGKTDALKDTWVGTRTDTREVGLEELAPTPFGGREGERLSSKEIRNLVEEFAAPLDVTPEKATPLSVDGKLQFSAEALVIGRKRQERLDLTVAYGDITAVDTRAIVLGVFRDVAPSGAAGAMDRELGHAITEFSDRRMISASVGSVFVMPANRYRVGAEMVFFVGLGTYDDFNEQVLRLAAENVSRVLVRTKVDDFATVLMGAASGMPPSEVLENLMIGFTQGLAEGDHGGRLRSVTLVEHDRERCEVLHRDLVYLTTTPLFDGVEATVYQEELPLVSRSRDGWGGGSPPSAGSDDPAYLLVREVPLRDDSLTDPSLDAPFVIRASVLSAGSKATVFTDSIEVDVRGLNRHLAKIETRTGFGFSQLGEFGQKLADLVLPRLVRTALMGLNDSYLMVIHDARTSRIPWEVLNIPRDNGDNWFPAATGGMSRKYEATDLSVAKWQESRRLTAGLNILLVIDPTEDLPGALAEGAKLKDQLAGFAAVEVDELIGGEATYSAISEALQSGRYDIVHYAGHAFFDPLDRQRSGLLCAGHVVLSGADLAVVQNLPALIFFNACESGRVRRAAERDSGRGTALRLETNVGVAEALLRAGVGNFIGTYWPVGDAAAMEFGTTFYAAIIQGEPIGDALLEARKKVKALSSEDWADYIHYGSPGFRVKLTP